MFLTSLAVFIIIAIIGLDVNKNNSNEIKRIKKDLEYTKQELKNEKKKYDDLVNDLTCVNQATKSYFGNPDYYGDLKDLCDLNEVIIEKGICYFIGRYNEKRYYHFKRGGKEIYVKMVNHNMGSYKECYLGLIEVLKKLK